MNESTVSSETRRKDDEKNNKLPSEEKPINGKSETTKTKKEQLDRSHITTLPGFPETYKCRICEKVFRNKKGKCYHDACITGVKPYKCNVCERSFVKRSHFEYHERIHSGYKPFKCNLCDKAFPQKNKLNRHMFSHNQEKQFACRKCGKRYSKRDDLKNHMSLHTGITPYSCKSCGKAFRILTNLNRHMHTHSDERPYTCEMCSKSFKDKSLLIRHKRTHGKEKPFSCDHCSRLFLSKSELGRHLAIHTDVKPFSCTYCHTVFRRKDNLNRHIRHHHAEGETNGKSRESEETRVAISEEKSSKSEKTENSRPKVTRVQKTKVKKLSKPLIIPPTKIPANSFIPSENSRDQINSRIDSRGNITPIIRGPGELSNAVPVINGPIRTTISRSEDKIFPRKKTFTCTEPIPLAEAVVINRRIEEKLYPQSTALSNNYYFFRKPGNTRDLPSSQSILNLSSSSTPASNNLTTTSNVTVKPAIVAYNKVPIETNYVERQEFSRAEAAASFQNLNKVSSSLFMRTNTNQSLQESKDFVSKADALNAGKLNESNVEKFRTNDTMIVNDSKSLFEGTNCVPTIQMCNSTNFNRVSNTHWRRRTAESLKSSHPLAE